MTYFETHKKPLTPLEQSFVHSSWILLAVALILPSALRLFADGVFWTPNFTVFFRAVGMDPMNAAGFASVFVLYAAARPQKKSFLTITGLGALLEAAYLFFFLPPEMTTGQRLLSLGGGFAVAGMIGLVQQAASAESLYARRRAAMLTRLALALLLYPFTGARLLGILSQASPMVYDTYGYIVAGSLGIPPSFLVAKFLTLHPVMGFLLSAVYSRLPIWIALAFGLNLAYQNRCHANLLYAYLLSGVFVPAFYLILPMVGIDLFLGSKYYPLGPLPQTVHLRLLEAPPDWPRSCLPSMHVSWILLSFFCVRHISRKAAWGYGLVVAATVISAMGPLIGHYSIDFVPSVPYALFILALTNLKLKWADSLRLVCLVWGLLSTVLFSLAIRLQARFLADHPALFWGSSSLIVLVSLWLENRLAKKALSTPDLSSSS